MLTDDDIIRLTTAFSKVFATKDDLKGFATKDDLKGFATKDDLKGFATKDDLKGFATKDDLFDMEERIIDITLTTAPFDLLLTQEVHMQKYVILSIS